MIQGLTAWLRELVPHARSEAQVNPAHLFAGYERQLDLLARRVPQQRVTEREHLRVNILEMYESDRRRKESIEKRAEVLLLLNGATAAIFIPLTLNTPPTGLHARFYLVAWMTLAGLGLIYILAALMFTLSIYRRIPRHILSLDELTEGDALVHSSKHIVRTARLIVENWKINNRWAERLEVSRRYFRNSVLLLFAAILLTKAPDFITTLNGARAVEPPTLRCPPAEPRAPGTKATQRSVRTSPVVAIRKTNIGIMPPATPGAHRLP